MAGADVQLKTVDMNREDEHECARDGRPPGPIDHASDAYEGVSRREVRLFFCPPPCGEWL